MVDIHAGFPAQDIGSALSGGNLATQPWNHVLLLLLQTVEQQGSQIRRLEGILAAETFTNSNQHSNSSTQHSPSSLVVSVAHEVRNTQQQLKLLQEQTACCRQQHELARNWQTDTLQQLQKLECVTQHLELQQQFIHSQMGFRNMPGPKHKSCTAQSQESRTPEPVAGCPPGSLAQRLRQLEQEVKCLSRTISHAQENSQAAAFAVHALQHKVSKQVQNVREDTKHAISVATSAACCVLKTEVQAQITSQAADIEGRMEQKLGGCNAYTNAHLPAMSAATSSQLDDLDARIAAVQDAQQQQLHTMQQHLKKMAQGKVDMHLLTAYIQQVNEVVEYLSTALVDTAQKSNAELASEQQRLSYTIHSLTAAKADASALAQLQQQLEDMRRDLAAVSNAAESATASAAAARKFAELVDTLRLELAAVQGSVAALLAENTRLQSCGRGHEKLLKDHSKQLSCLCSKQDMLQQQLVALTNHIDPAAAAVLAATSDDAAMTGTRSIATAEDAAQMSDSSALPAVPHVECNPPNMSNAQQLLLKQSTSTLEDSDALSKQTHIHAPRLQAALQHLSISSKTVKDTADSTSSTIPQAPGIVRHLPLAMRLCLVENGLQDMQRCLAAQASAGDMAALTMHVEGLSKRLSVTAESLRGMHSGSIEQLEQQYSSMQEASKCLEDLLKDRPTYNQVLEMVQQAIAAREIAPCEQAATAIQQELQAVCVHMEAAQRQLAEAQHDIGLLQEWQASMGKSQAAALQKLQDQLETQWQGRLRQLASDSKQAVAEAVQEMMTQQAVSDRTAHKQLKQQIAALTGKVILFNAKLESLEKEAASLRLGQDQNTNAVSALESKLSAYISQSSATADHQQLRQQQQQQQLNEDLTAQLQQTCRSHDTRLAAFESAVKEQATALLGLEELLAGFPSKEAMTEAAVASATVTAQKMLQEHRREEEERWEVWLAEFARALKERPTASQVQQQLHNLQLQQQLPAAKTAEQHTVEAAEDNASANS